MKNIVIGLIVAFASMLAKGDVIDDIYRLNMYIDSACKSSCVNAGVLYKALVKVKKEQAVDPVKMLAIIRQESAFKVRASNKGNVGLAQVLLKYHRSKFKSKDYFDVEDNISVGSSIYKTCAIKHKGNLRQSFRCYNGYHLGDKLYYEKIAKHIKAIESFGLFR